MLNFVNRIHFYYYSSYLRKQINVCRICKINFIVLISRLYSGTSITSFTYNDPCQLVKAGRAFNPKIQKISYIYKYKYQLLKS